MYTEIKLFTGSQGAVTHFLAHAAEGDTKGGPPDGQTRGARLWSADRRIAGLLGRARYRQIGCVVKTVTFVVDAVVPVHTSLMMMPFWSCVTVHVFWPLFRVTERLALS